jgi:MYXO-CTERM domain-containing protein
VEEGWTCEGAPSVCSNPCDGPRPCGADPVDEGSCACSAPGSAGSSSGIGLAFGLSAVLLARRRRAAMRTRAG